MYWYSKKFREKSLKQQLIEAVIEGKKKKEDKLTLSEEEKGQYDTIMCNLKENILRYVENGNMNFILLDEKETYSKDGNLSPLYRKLTRKFEEENINLKMINFNDGQMLVIDLESLFL